MTTDTSPLPTAKDYSAAIQEALGIPLTQLPNEGEDYFHIANLAAQYHRVSAPAAFAKKLARCISALPSTEHRALVIQAVFTTAARR